jgi:hypothetical protein
MATAHMAARNTANSKSRRCRMGLISLKSQCICLLAQHSHFRGLTKSVRSLQTLMDLTRKASRKRSCVTRLRNEGLSLFIRDKTRVFSSGGGNQIIGHLSPLISNGDNRPMRVSRIELLEMRLGDFCTIWAWRGRLGVDPSVETGKIRMLLPKRDSQHQWRSCEVICRAAEAQPR